MPRHWVHRKINKLVLGKDYDFVNKFADLILGPHHRKKWGHDIKHVALTYFLTKDPKAALAHYLHIITDEFESKLKKMLKQKH